MSNPFHLQKFESYRRSKVGSPAVYFTSLAEHQQAKKVTKDNKGAGIGRKV